MSGLPDPALIEASATRLAQYAGTVRERADQLARSADDCGWDGPAARAFRREAAEVVARLRAAARRLDDAADALRRHAVEVRAELDVLGREIRALTRTVGFGR